MGDVASHSDWNDVATDDTYGSGFDATNSGDDRIYDFNSSDYRGDYTAQEPETTMPLQSGVDEVRPGLFVHSYASDRKRSLRRRQPEWADRARRGLQDYL